MLHRPSNYNSFLSPRVLRFGHKHCLVDTHVFQARNPRPRSAVSRNCTPQCFIITSVATLKDLLIKLVSHWELRRWTPKPSEALVASRQLCSTGEGRSPELSHQTPNDPSKLMTSESSERPEQLVTKSTLPPRSGSTATSISYGPPWFGSVTEKWLSSSSSSQENDAKKTCDSALCPSLFGDWIKVWFQALIAVSK